ncbi:MAG TPA: hypothetical protein VHO25_22510, partial [Polyangiaceae bacterium]|nr:hypothetical protein [Polyangiaceae bacterium]
MRFLREQWGCVTWGLATAVLGLTSCSDSAPEDTLESGTIQHAVTQLGPASSDAGVRAAPKKVTGGASLGARMGRRLAARQEHRAGEVLVQFRPGKAASRAHGVASGLGSRVMRGFKSTLKPSRLNDVVLAELPQGMNVDDAVQAFQAESDVVWAQPNYVYHPSVPYIPNDTHFGVMWGLDNTGQAALVGLLGARQDADIDWPEAWERINASATFGPNVIVAVIDTGVDYTHPDLDAVIWTN